MSISREEIDRRYGAYIRCGESWADAARELGLQPDTLRKSICSAAAHGFLPMHPVMPGFRIKQIASKTKDGHFVKQVLDRGSKFEVPVGHRVKGVSAYTDADGHLTGQWIKTQDDREVDWVAILKGAFDDVPREDAIKEPKVRERDLLNFFPCNDWHINQLCWARDVGENWDLQIAEKVIGDAVEDVIVRTPPADVAVILGGGDLMHNDDNTNRTAKSGNVLDADGRHRKGMEVAIRLMDRTVKAALKNNAFVIFKILKGNHDEMSSTAISYYFKAKYENEPRVRIDLDNPMFFFYQHGKTLIAATHGHACKLVKLPMVAACSKDVDFSGSEFRYGHGFHVHNRGILKEDGMILETHQAPVAKDDWHHSMGYVSGRSVTSITYHKETGEYDRKTNGIRGGIGNLIKKRKAA
jgi:hypothetical protein